MLTGQMVRQLVGLLTSIIVARSLGSEGRGLVAAVIFAPQIVLLLCSGGFGDAAAMLIRKKAWPVADVVRTLLLAAVAASAIGMGLCWVWLRYFGEPEYTTVLVAAALLIVPGSVLFQYLSGMFLGINRIPTYAVKTWGPTVGKFILSLLFVLILGFGAEGAVSAIALSGIGVAVFYFLKLSQVTSIRPGWNRELIVTMAKTGFALSSVFLLMILIYRSNVVLIQKFGNLSELGIYAIGALLAELLWRLPALVSGLLFARSAAAEDGAAFAQKVAVLTRLTFLAGVLISIVLVVIAPVLVHLLYGAEFARSADVLRALLPGTLAMMIFKLLRTDLAAKGRPWVVLWIALPMLASLLLLGPIIIPDHGALGAAYLTSCIYVVGTIFVLPLYCRIANIPLGELVTYRKRDFTLAWGALSSKLRKTRG